MNSRLAACRYGKDNVRLFKVMRDEKTGVQTVVENTVTCLIDGEIESSYTKADNSVVVATDSIKNTIHILAKQNPVTPPELFGTIIGNHFITRYNHIHAAHVKIVTHRWTRMNIDGKPHPHSFYKDSEEKRTVEVDMVEGKGVDIRTFITDLTVLKSTGSQFWGFVRDEYTTLKETWDRIMSTDVACNWHWKHFSGLDEVRSVANQFTPTWEKARNITLDTFAKDDSASVQATMYKMADQILGAQPLVETVEYSLPNKHYFEIDLSWHKGLQNTGKNAEVYAPQSNPNGLIKCTVSRPSVKREIKSRL
ncbi:hypothetical protein PHISCL_02049 [Aspergillus sclerotialis]|uniref:Uricase n=1 Tax=Aspergillus sclerotialis TaxID=2070753 RepID=A0A3A2ZQY5_9EURO|nr:hypothetical protein PHISCL_02049 [Aspergillus sclerotialis]